MAVKKIIAICMCGTRGKMEYRDAWLYRKQCCCAACQKLINKITALGPDKDAQRQVSETYARRILRRRA